MALMKMMVYATSANMPLEADNIDPKRFFEPAHRMAMITASQKRIHIFNANTTQKIEMHIHNKNLTSDSSMKTDE
jgi:hypothetical protein